MALCKIKQKKFEEALESAEKAIKADPKYIKGYYRRASAKLKLGNRMEACLDFKRILEIEEDNEQVRKQLEKEKNKLTENEKKTVDEFNEGFKRVEIEEGTDSESESDESEQEEKENISNSNDSNDSQLKEFVVRLQQKKEKMTKEIKAGLFEGVITELSENISDAEDKRNEIFSLKTCMISGILLNRKKFQKASITSKMIDEWLTTEKMNIPPQETHPNLHLLLELELSLKSNLCYSFKQIGQDKKLCYVASNVLTLCSKLMRGQGALSVKANQIFQKTIKRRALGLEQNEKTKNSFRDFWVARTFDSFDSMIVKGLNRTKQALETDGIKETSIIEKDFEKFLQFFKNEKKKSESENKTPEKDLLASSVFESVPNVEESKSTEREVNATSVTESPKKNLTENVSLTPQKKENTEILAPTKKEETPKQPEKESFVEIKNISSVIEVNLNNSQLDNLEELKAMGNVCFKKKDYKTAIEKFSLPITKMLKGPNTDFLKGNLNNKNNFQPIKFYQEIKWQILEKKKTNPPIQQKKN